MMNALSQRDPRWAATKLGTSELTIGQAGCLITAIASLLNDMVNTTLTPATLNAWLVERHGYVDDNLFIFNAVDAYGITCVEVPQCWTTPAPITGWRHDMETGAQVVALVDAKPGGKVDGHWVRLLRIGPSNIELMDPWQLPGQEKLNLLPKYGLPNWGPARAIFMAAIFRQTTRNVAPTSDPIQPFISVYPEVP